nr:kinesin-like protein KIN-14C [Tanacetum cinerariifolium]
ALKQREDAVKEVGVLRGELQQVREDRECQLLLVQHLNSQLARFEENTGRLVPLKENKYHYYMSRLLQTRN